MPPKNPNTFRIPEPIWRLWIFRPNPDWELGGIYADKDGYHNSVTVNKTKWPNNYSIELPLDLKPVANFNFARAIDLTMSPSEMIKWTSRMRASALDPRDNRLAAVKEFYGTLDGKTVYGLSKDSENGKWERSTADKTHLWHGHMSIFTYYVNNWAVLQPILSVWEGVSFEDWNDMSFLPKQGDEGQTVAFWQRIHNKVRSAFPAIPELKVDGDWGPSTTAAVHAFWKACGQTGKYKGDYLDSWVAYMYLAEWIEIVDRSNQDAPSTVQVDPKVLEALVNARVDGIMDGLIRTGFDFTGHITGSVNKPALVPSSVLPVAKGTSPNH